MVIIAADQADNPIVLEDGNQASSNIMTYSIGNNVASLAIASMVLLIEFNPCR